jgi:hypothetical protein
LKWIQWRWRPRRQVHPPRRQLASAGTEHRPASQVSGGPCAARFPEAVGRSRFARIAERGIAALAEVEAMVGRPRSCSRAREKVLVAAEVPSAVRRVTFLANLRMAIRLRGAFASGSLSMRCSDTSGFHHVWRPQRGLCRSGRGKCLEKCQPHPAAAGRRRKMLTALTTRRRCICSSNTVVAFRASICCGDACGGRRKRAALGVRRHDVF